MGTKIEIIVVLGPTCSWKSEVACRLAETLDGEVISCDSMQVYRGLAVGTAQPSEEMQARIRHHLIDCLDISERYDASRFVDMANQAIDDIQSRGKRVIMVGGTGLYARALIYGMSLLPSDHDLAMAMRPLIETPEGRLALWNELLAAAGNEDSIPDDVRLNPRRLLRACEVVRLTGNVPWKIASKNQIPDSRFRQYCIIPDFAMLKERIRRRTRLMIEHGWIQEALAAEKKGLLNTPTAHQALGYRDIIEHCIHHRLDIPHGLSLEDVLANRTINYARRQLTWFKHQHPGATLICIDNQDNAVDTICREMEM